ncbi:MAG: NAD-dependent epimerase/dehydratase family protein [Eubacterium sp.]|nr:NAD-dependent epimerase/dehydratase family protein [Eubacterium sp.]
MKAFMIGGTGLLGSAAAKILIDRGNEVKTLSLPPLPVGAEFPEQMEIILKDANKLSDDEILKLMEGSDVFVFATGVDERVEFSAPVYDKYYQYNIAPLERYLPLAKKAGIKGAVVCGSYFAWLNKAQPDMKLYEKHPYIRSRIDQEKVCEKYSDKDFSVAVLELPYIFGTQPGRKPVWVILIEQLKRFEKMPFTMYPAGGTAMLTVRQTGEALAGAAEHAYSASLNGEGRFRAYGISCYNMTWRKFLKIVYRAMDGTPNRRIVDVPKWTFKAFGYKMRGDYAKRNVDYGIDPVGLADIMGMNLFIPTDDCAELGCTPDDIEAAIFDSIKLSKEAFDGNAQLIGMKGE